MGIGGIVVLLLVFYYLFKHCTATSQSVSPIGLDGIVYVQFYACKYNKACREIYERIVAKGKSKKLALIAVCNKLLKQAFAIAKSELIYNQEYKSTLAKN